MRLLPLAKLWKSFSVVVSLCLACCVLLPSKIWEWWLSPHLYVSLRQFTQFCERVSVVGFLGRYADCMYITRESCALISKASNNYSSLDPQHSHWSAGENLVIGLPSTKAKKARDFAELLACPKVYVYTLREPWQDGRLHKWNDVVRYTFGGKMDDIKKKGITDQNQHKLAIVLWYRLVFSKRCRTMDPRKADLFAVPLLAKPKGEEGWRHTCDSLATRQEQLLNQLPFLNEATAPFHFMIGGKGFGSLKRCYGFWSEPVGVFAKVARVSAEVGLHSSRESCECSFEQHADDMQRLMYYHNMGNPWTPRVYNVPYASSVHYAGPGSIKFWEATNRTVFLSFSGSAYHGDVAARRAVNSTCHQGYGDVECFVNLDLDFDWKASLALKRKAVFCMEPIGDTIGRKSLADSIASGCIPVFLGCLMAWQLPEYWSYWESPAFVTIHRARVLRGEIDIYNTLKNIPDTQIRALQSQIWRYASLFQYHAQDDLEVPDALDVLLRSLWRDGQKLRE